MLIDRIQSLLVVFIVCLLCQFIFLVRDGNCVYPTLFISVGWDRAFPFSHVVFSSSVSTVGKEKTHIQHTLRTSIIEKEDNGTRVCDEMF